jgi:hypothetical protein
VRFSRLIPRPKQHSIDRMAAVEDSWMLGRAFEPDFASPSVKNPPLGRDLPCEPRPPRRARCSTHGAHTRPVARRSSRTVLAARHAALPSRPPREQLPISAPKRRSLGARAKDSLLDTYEAERRPIAQPSGRSI